MTDIPARLLVIAGSDSGGGAGIQADIKTATALGVYAMTAVTAVTAQDTRGIHAIHPVPASIVREQIACCLSDIGADAIKIGMLGSAAIARTVAAVLESEAQGIPLVLDPVLESTSGTSLLDENGTAILRGRLIRLATLITPNAPELAKLAGVPVSGKDQAFAAANILLGAGARSVLIKGGHAKSSAVEDFLLWDGGLESYFYPRVKTPHTHGTGCTLSTAVACGLAEGLTLPLAVGRAREYVQHAIESAPGLGHGRGPLGHVPGIGRVERNALR